MASIWKHPKSPFWTACFTDETGRQIKRSTKLEDKTLALQMAEDLEAAAKKARCAELTRAAAVKVLNGLMERMPGERGAGRSICKHFAEYQAGLQARGAGEGTLRRYRPIFEGFLAHLGEARSNDGLASVSSEELEAYRDAELRAGKTPGTADFALKVLNGVFEDAWRKAMILHNPVQGVRLRSHAVKEGRQTFTDAQVSALLAVADVEWRGMILLACHAGVRLKDAANLTHQNIEGGKLLRFREAKSAQRKPRASESETEVVMADDLCEYLRSLPVPMRKDAPLFPSLFGRQSGSAGGLSNMFMRLMERAGIDRGQGVEREGKGRRVSALGFDSLRFCQRPAGAGPSAWPRIEPDLSC